MQKFEESKPVVGDPVTYHSYGGEQHGKVTRVVGDLCHVEYDHGVHDMFIWRFNEGLNKLHDWPTKAAGVQHAAS